MRKFLIFIITIGFIVPVFAFEAHEKQIKSALEEEKQAKQEKQNPQIEEDDIDYEDLNRQTRFETGKSRNKGHVSAGYEHVRSKYQANTSLKKYKAEFTELKNFELKLLKLTPYETDMNDDTAGKNKEKD